MYLLVYFLILPLGLNECAKSRSVNLALETVFEFDNVTDITFVESVQDFLSKVKGALEYSYRRNEQPRRYNSLLLTEFIEDSIKILKSYNDLDLAYFIELLDTEINEHDYQKCEVKIKNEISLRKFIAEKLSDARNSPVEKIRRNLDDILRELRNKRDSRSQIYNFLNSLVKRHSQERFRSILDNLQLYRRRKMDPTMTLRMVVQDSIRSLIKDYICDYSHSKKIRNIIKTLNEDAEVDFLKLKNGFRWDRNQKKVMEENDRMYGLEIINNNWNFAEMNKHANQYSVDERGDKQKYKKIKPQSNENSNSEDNKEKTYKKRKTNASLTNSADILDLKIDYNYSEDYETKLDNKYENFNDATKIMFKTKDKKTRPYYVAKKSYSSKHDDSVRDYSESKEDRSNVFEYTIPTVKKLKTTKKKRFKTFVTLYPEIISYMTRSVKKKKKSIDNIRKKFSKLNKEGQSKEEIKEKKDERKEVKSKTEEVIGIHETDINMPMNKSVEPEHTFKNQYSPKKRFKIKSNLSTLKIQGSKSINKDVKKAFESEEISKNISSEASSKQYNDIEHFGSLYKQKNNQTPEIIYRGYRKSNNLVTSGSNKFENKTSKTTSVTTKTIGTLQFWRGTKKPTVKTSTVKITKEMFSKKKSLRKVGAQLDVTNVSVNANKNITSFEANDKTTIANRSQNMLNTSDVTSVQNYTSFKNSIENITKYRKDTASYSFTNSASMETTNALEIVKKEDLRRLLDNSIINEIQEDSQRKKLSQRFQEDLNKVFLIPPVQIPKKSKEFNTDPIDEIEDVFDLR